VPAHSSPAALAASGGPWPTGWPPTGPAAAKAGVVALTRTAALELAPLVRVNAVMLKALLEDHE